MKGGRLKRLITLGQLQLLVLQQDSRGGLRLVRATFHFWPLLNTKFNMKIYHYHPETGVFLGEGKADPSPLEEGIWLIPAHSTTISPPPFGEGEQAVMVNSSWGVQPVPEDTQESVTAPTLLPEISSELTVEQKLARVGLTVEDLRALLG